MKTAAVSTFFLASLTFVPALHAAPVVTATGDIILGFKADGGEGSETSLEVNLGPASTFRNAGADPFPVLGRLAVQDLIASYGEDWATREDLSWGLAGTTKDSVVGGVPARTVWASRAEDPAGTPSVPWRTGTLQQMGPPKDVVAALYTGSPGSLGNLGLNATVNSPYSARILTTLAGSWAEREASQPGVSFGYFNPSVMRTVSTLSAPGSAYDGKAYSVLDLYEVRAISPAQDATRLGALGLNAEGQLVFSKDITKFAAPSTTVELGQPTLTLNGNSATVVLASAPTGNYSLERSTTLLVDSWIPVQTHMSVSGTLTFNDAAAPSGRSFYRIRKTQ